MKEGTLNPVSDRHAERLSGLWLTPQDMGILLQIHPKTVIRYLEQGKLPGRKIGAKWRTPKAQFDALQLPEQTDSS